MFCMIQYNMYRQFFTEISTVIYQIFLKVVFLARLLILIKKGGLLQLKFGGVGVGVNIYLWAR